MKHSRLIAATGVMGAACVFALPAAQAAPGGHPGHTGHGVAAGQGIEKGDTAFVDTTAATLWGDPSMPRSLDKPSTTNPADLDRWNAAMKDTDTRDWLTGHTETQAVYGSEVLVTEVKGDWAKVVVRDQSTPLDERGYPGWMPVGQLVENPAFDRAKDTSQRAVVTASKAKLSGVSAKAREDRSLSFNTELPVLHRAGSRVQVSLPDGEKGWVSADDVALYSAGQKPEKPSGDEVVQTGKQFLGLRYLWAGVSSYGYDCSGFTYSMYRAHGIDIPRDADAQAEFGQDVDKDDLKPGDLLFFAEPGGKGAVHHVGMYAGDGKMIHAPNASTTVSITDWKSWDSKNEFSGAKRML